MSAFLSQSSKASQKECHLTPAPQYPYWPQLLKPGSPLLGIFFPPVFVSAHRRKKKLSPKENSEGFWVLLRRWDEALAQLSPQADTLEVRCLLILFQ